MRCKILLVYIFLFLFPRKGSADIAGTNLVYHTGDHFVGVFTEVPDDPLPAPLQSGIHWIPDGPITCQWYVTGNLSPISGTNQLKLGLDFCQPCSGTVSVALFQRWVDSNDRSRMVITKSTPLAAVGIDVINLRYETYHSMGEEDGNLFLFGGTVPATITNMGLTQTRDINFNFTCSNKFFLFNPAKLILSRSKRTADYEIVCPTDLEKNAGKFSFEAIPEND